MNDEMEWIDKWRERAIWLGDQQLAMQRFLKQLGQFILMVLLCICITPVVWAYGKVRGLDR